jgi:hypothetical protein
MAANGSEGGEHRIHFMFVDNSPESACVGVLSVFLQKQSVFLLIKGHIQ